MTIEDQIMPMSNGDYEDAFALWTGTAGMGLRSLDDSRDGIVRFLKRNPRTSFVCRINDRLTGVILCGHDGRRGYIYHAAVHEEYRNRGIGRALVERVVAALDDEGITKTALVAYGSNTRGNAFWESLGFTLRDDLVYRDRVINPENR